VTLCRCSSTQTCSCGTRRHGTCSRFRWPPSATGWCTRWAGSCPDVAHIDALGGYLQDLGREHRKFGAVAGYYPYVRASLLATLAHFNGPAWTPELAAGWKAAYDLVAEVMIKAAAEDAGARPAIWDATVVAHELRRFDIATFRVATTEPLSYLPGQSVSMESSERPRIWRFYSPANVPRDDLTMDFHVRMIDGGALSMVLTRGLAVGARLRIGSPVGTLTYQPGTGRDALLVAGSTGLAPLKAIAEQISGLRDPPGVHLLFGARTADGLYDLTDLEKMAARQPWLTVIPVVSDEPGYPGERGMLHEALARSGNWRGHDVYASGPTPMVEATVTQLMALGVPRSQIHVEDFGWSEP
jgi:NAD(P)H-flavin reductase